MTRGEAARAGGASGASARTTGRQERRAEGGVGVASTPLGQGGFDAALRDALGMAQHNHGVERRRARSGRVSFGERQDAPVLGAPAA